MNNTLAQIIFAFADKTHALPEHILNNEGWGWDAYAGIRYGFIHLGLELRRLTAAIYEERAKQSAAMTRTQSILAQHHAAFRDFQALLIGVDDDQLDRVPKLGEWSLRTIITHVHEAERYFFVHILNALDNENPQPLNREQRAAILGDSGPPALEGTLKELWTRYDQLHNRILNQLSSLTSEELQTLSPMWEPQSLPIEFRMLRFAAHVREHANQLEKTLGWLDQRPHESKLLLRQLYAALAEAEGASIGTENIGAELCQQTAALLNQRSAAMMAAVERANGVLSAVETGDIETLQAAISDNQGWARTQMPDGLSALVYSKYRGRDEVVALLQAACDEFSFFEAALLGNLDELKAWLTYQPTVLNTFSSDGYTALQLASFFGQPNAVKRLLEANADVHAVSQNAMRIQPLHAAVAAHNLEIVKLLIAAGADVNAKQQDDFTALMGAQQNKDEEMVRVLREAGAK